MTWEEAERLVQDGAQKKGYFVFNFNEQRRTAPMHSGDHCRVITPDLDLVGNGVRRFAEVKLKSQASYTRKTKQDEHGICRRALMHYRQFEEASGVPVWLFLVQLDISAVLYAPIKGWLATYGRDYSGDRMCEHGMVFWPASVFYNAALIDDFRAGKWQDEPLRRQF